MIDYVLGVVVLEKYHARLGFQEKSMSDAMMNKIKTYFASNPIIAGLVVDNEQYELVGPNMVRAKYKLRLRSDVDELLDTIFASPGFMRDIDGQPRISCGISSYTLRIRQDIPSISNGCKQSTLL